MAVMKVNKSLTNLQIYDLKQFEPLNLEMHVQRYGILFRELYY